MKPLVIVGPTSSGKTDLSFWLCENIPHELRAHGIDILVLDSKQVYSHQDIVTGKDLTGRKLPKQTRVFGVDLVNPDQEWSVAQSIAYAEKIIQNAKREGRFLLLVGGTPQYLLSIFEKPQSFIVQPDSVLRAQLESLKVIELQQQLCSIDAHRYEKMNHSDRNNSRRLIRAIELGKNNFLDEPKEPLLLISACHWIGLLPEKKALESKIRERVRARIAQGAIAEYSSLFAKYSNWTKEASAAIGYHEIAQHLSGDLAEDQLVDLWTLHELQYAKRQMTWWKRERQIQWFDTPSNTLKDQVLSYIKSCYNESK